MREWWGTEGQAGIMRLWAIEHPWQYCKYLITTSILATTSILVMVDDTHLCVCRVVSMPVHARLVMGCQELSLTFLIDPLICYTIYF